MPEKIKECKHEMMECAVCGKEMFQPKCDHVEISEGVLEKIRKEFIKNFSLFSKYDISSEYFDGYKGGMLDLSKELTQRFSMPKIRLPERKKHNKNIKLHDTPLIREAKGIGHNEALDQVEKLNPKMISRREETDQ